ncbi:hypothetical protein IEQ34_013301 [Dendrobium chrysotoxum]|uniref:DUF4283 domain-containing protein n=1 Tax=Dendrobium chrysotoxum TaxID=161865 RepID=A0AAV7GP91_DENCH|nr:hypothetical protein IEQ34_013301 [Dendrobium chrysotoxum]
MAANWFLDPDFLDGSMKSRSFLDALSGSASDYALVPFFPSRHPSLDSIYRFFFNLKLIVNFSVTLLDSSYVLIKLMSNLDYSRAFYHRSYLIYNCYVKLTKWYHSLDISVESPIIPIWISFPNLRPHLFSP